MYLHTYVCIRITFVHIRMQIQFQIGLRQHQFFCFSLLYVHMQLAIVIYADLNLNFYIQRAFNCLFAPFLSKMIALKQLATYIYASSIALFKIQAVNDVQFHSRLTFRCLVGRKFNHKVEQYFNITPFHNISHGKTSSKTDFSGLYCYIKFPYFSMVVQLLSAKLSNHGKMEGFPVDLKNVLFKEVFM